MWVIVVVAGLLIVATTVHRLRSRADRVPPLERHEKALAALADIAHEPRPPVPEPHETGVPPGHIRILPEPPDRVPRKRATKRPAAAVNRRTKTAAARARHPSTGKRVHADVAARPTLHIGFEQPGEPIEATLSDTAAAGTPAEPVFSPAPAPDARPAVPSAASWAKPRRHHSGRATRAALVGAVIVAGGAVGMAIASGGAHPKASARAPRVADQPAAVTEPPTTAALPPTTAPVRFTSQILPTGDANVSVPGAFTLTLHATGMCWVQVSAANGQTLFMGTLYPGQNQQLVGSAPLVVRLGNTPGMALTIDGTALNLNGVGRTANLHFLS
jgi:hypothetical protein